jgi:hypothetical protein
MPSSRATTEAAALAAEHGSAWEALGNSGSKSTVRSPRRASWRSTRCSTVRTSSPQPLEPPRRRASRRTSTRLWEALARPGFDDRDRAEIEGIIRRAFPALNGSDEESPAAVAVVAEAAAIAGLVGVQQPGPTRRGM